MRRIPIIASVVVLAAVATMIALGIWQLSRAEEKEALLARYDGALSNNDAVKWPGDGPKHEKLLYARSRLNCETAKDFSTSAGKNADGQSGLSVTAKCHAAGGVIVPVVLGWTREVTIPDWDGGPVEGIIAPGPRLVLDPPQAGLEANARPDPADLPNNHLAYAGQWFFFALTALGIYGFALRRRWRDEDNGAA